ncbi:MAG TPA: M20/M25/M40 family metallo-hydrolase [Terriglobales bacterium]|nr:M20/M25/M40 family metallo-hydrolase [Terriglobales bacterium]
MTRRSAPLLLLAVSVSLWGQASPERYAKDVTTLADPKMQGRGAGTKGLEHARDHLQKRFAALKLQPAGDNGYLQPFTVTTGAKLRGKNKLEATIAGKKQRLAIERDYIPFSFSATSDVTGPVVFAGYGVSASDAGYDDYFHFDVKDKIVVLLRYEPASLTKKAGQRTSHAQLVNKAINARNHGAKAVVLVNGKLDGKEEDLLPRFGSLAGPENAGIAMVQVTNSIADGWLKLAGKSLEQVQNQIDTTSSPQSFALPANVALEVKVDLERVQAKVSNVVAYLPGESDEYVILGAHYDHLGFGNGSSLAPSMIGKVHPGADDNASGTSGLLELARLLSEQKDRKRGVLFIAFSGEEIGLLGSAYWVNHPTKSLDKAVAMINMDMIGRIKPDGRIFLGASGSGSNFKEIIEQVSAKHQLKLETSGAGSGSSDHISFLAKQIPSLFFFSGLHADYHKPSDTAEKIESGQAAKLLNFIADLTQELERTQRAQFIRVEEPRPVSGGSGGGGYGPYFGSVPDMGENAGGVKFADVRKNSPADKAGLKPGDVMTRFGDKPITNLYDFTFALRQYKIGDTLDVTVLREGKPMTVKVTLEQRK